jgi:hypothetical protein
VRTLRILEGSKNTMKTALLLINIQKDYFSGGKMELVNLLEAEKKAYMLLNVLPRILQI